MSAARLSDTDTIATGDVLATEFGSELVILNLRDGVYYGLGDVGARIWRLLDSPRTLASLCEAILAEYEVDAVRCADDVRALIQDLAAHNLVTILPT